MESLFETWKPRASQFGYLLTNLPEKFTSDDGNKLQDLLDEEKNGVNANGNKTKWTDNKQADVDKLNRKKESLDTLPDGAITKLEEIFDAVFWKRKKPLENKFLEKGIISEEDSLQLISDIDSYGGVPTFYCKNEEQIENDYAQGLPDNIQDMVRDVKTNYDYFTFKAAKSKSDTIALYRFQIKCYIWILISIGRNISRTGELIYCLVNTPAHIIQRELESMWHKMGKPQLKEDEDNNMHFKDVEKASQFERNHICDIVQFKKEFSTFDLENKEWRNIPKHMRLKRFEVTLEDEDIEHMIRRSKMCKKWLIERELKEIEIINSVKF